MLRILFSHLCDSFVSTKCVLIHKTCTIQPCFWSFGGSVTNVKTLLLLSAVNYLYIQQTLIITRVLLSQSQVTIFNIKSFQIFFGPNQLLKEVSVSLAVKCYTMFNSQMLILFSAENSCLLQLDKGLMSAVTLN